MAVAPGHRPDAALVTQTTTTVVPLGGIARATQQART